MDPRNAPTHAELAILRVLWDRGPGTVRDVHELLERRESVGYTTVLKTLQVMLEKGLVERDDATRAHIYSARVAARDTERRLVDDLRRRAFGGSTAKLVLRALADAPASRVELEEIREFLDRAERELEPGKGSA